MSDNPTKHHHAKSLLPADPTLPVKAIETMLVDKGLVHPAAIDTMVHGFENQIGQPNGARVVARSCADPDYRALLRDDVSAATLELGFSGLQDELTDEDNPVAPKEDWTDAYLLTPHRELVELERHKGKR